MKQLIINADDFGLHESINEGIIQAHLEGCVTSATVIAGGNAFQDAVRLAKENPKLSVGVHLTLVGLRPLSRGNVDSLTARDGDFYTSYTEFARQYLCDKILQHHIETELRCQMQKVVGSGIRISHLDSHQHLHALPGISKIIGQLATEFKVVKIRIPAEPLFFFNTAHSSLTRVMGRSVLTGCALWSRRQYKARQLYGPDHFFGMLSGGQTNQESLQMIIQRLPDGISEIMVHPGSNDQVLDEKLHWNYHWQDELAALKSPEILSLIREKRIGLISYYDL